MIYGIYSLNSPLDTRALGGVGCGGRVAQTLSLDKRANQLS
jgi:hypothetical protein